MMVKAATDKNKSGLMRTVAAWASKVVQSPSENDTNWPFWAIAEYCQRTDLVVADGYDGAIIGVADRDGT